MMQPRQVAVANGSSGWKEWKQRQKFTDTRTKLVSLLLESRLKILGAMNITSTIRCTTTSILDASTLQMMIMKHAMLISDMKEKVMMKEMPGVSMMVLLGSGQNAKNMTKVSNGTAMLVNGMFPQVTLNMT